MKLFVGVDTTLTFPIVSELVFKINSNYWLAIWDDHCILDSPERYIDFTSIHEVKEQYSKLKEIK